MKPLVFLLCVATLTSCSKRPEHIPSPQPGALSSFQRGCPDLRGTYQLRDQNGSPNIPPWTALRQALEKTPNHHTFFTIEHIDDKKIVISTDGSEEDIKKGFEQWRNTERYQYAIWRHSLDPRSTPTGVFLDVDTDIDPKAPLQPPHRFFRSQKIQRTIVGAYYQCRKGWVIFNGEEEPSQDHSDRAQVHLTTSKNGLVAYSKYYVQQSFSLWCGDGCKPDILLPDGHRQRWWHAPSQVAPPKPHIDWDRWAQNDDRPLHHQKQYLPGMIMLYATQDDIDNHSKKSRKEREDATPQMATHIRLSSYEDKQKYASQRPVPQARVACDRTQQLSQLLSQGSTAHTLDCRPDNRCTITGETVSAARLSDLIRSLDQQGFSGELHRMEQIPQHQMQFTFVIPDMCARIRE